MKKGEINLLKKLGWKSMWGRLLGRMLDIDIQCNLFKVDKNFSNPLYAINFVNYINSKAEIKLTEDIYKSEFLKEYF